MASKELEEYHIKSFLSKLNCLYNIIDIESESPDCIAIVNNKKVGIEHTLLRNQELSNVYSRISRIIKNAQAFFESECSEIINVKFSFISGFDGKGNRDKKSKEIAELVNYIIKNNDIRENERFLLDRTTDFESDTIKTLPSYIESISVQKNVNFKRSLWQKIGAYRVPVLTHKIISENIIVKNDKLNNIYLKNRGEFEIEEYWLLIVIEGMGRHSDWTYNPLDDFRNYKYETDFDKIFVFSVWKNNIEEEYIHVLNNKPNKI